MIHSSDIDAVVVGSGPCGVSSCYPLLEAGLRVQLLDGGQLAESPPPTEDFLSWRSWDHQQWRRTVGEDFRSLALQDATSPKMRIPALGYVFDRFLESNRISANEFIAVGSLAVGGLSAAWGCGVARVDEAELSSFPCDPERLLTSYARVARRIGISGAVDDDMRDFFGLDDWAQPPIPLDRLHETLLTAYGRRRERLLKEGFRLGRSRVAALSHDLGDRLSCNSSANCLWGCARRSLYNAADELSNLKKQANFLVHHGALVESLSRIDGAWIVNAIDLRSRERFAISAKRVFLAAGTLATTRLVLDALQFRQSVSMLSSPMAAFLLWLPRFSGRVYEKAFGLGQLSYAVRISCDGELCFGSTFSTTGIPVAEFASRLPLGRRFAVDLLSSLLPACLVGNAFLPGRYSAVSVRLGERGELVVTGCENPLVEKAWKEVVTKLRRAYLQLGALLIPNSFTRGAPGGDIHYAGTLPMRESPTGVETSSLGEVNGLSGLHVVDASCLPTLSGKSHTLTAMANADRIAREVADRIRC